jgi:4-amino-4-deoxy-L-arabinose transferase-like glycosyltransferase
VLLFVAAIASVSWSLAIAPLGGPDEEAHVAYTQRIAETGAFPQKLERGPRLAPELQGDRGGFSSELQAVLDRGLMWQMALKPYIKPNGSSVEWQAYDRYVAALEDGGSSDGTGFQPAANNPPLYYLYTTIPYAIGDSRSLLTRMEFMRWAGIPLLLVVVAMTWLLVAELIPRPYWARTLATGVVAVHPVLTFISGVVNPDIALAALWSSFLWMGVRTVRYGPTLRRALVLGAIVAASALVQPRGLALGLPMVFALGLAFRRFKTPWRTVVRWGGGALAISLVGVALFYWVLAVYGGDETSGWISTTANSSDFNVRQFLSYVWQFYLPPLKFMGPMFGPPRGFEYVWVESFYGVFGQLDIWVPNWVYDRLYTASVWGLVILAVLLVLRSDALRRHRAELAVLVVTVVTLLAGLHYAAYRALQGNGATDPILVGRYLFPIIPIFGLAVAFVCTSLPRRWGQYAGGLVLSSGVLLLVAGMGSAIVRYHF